MLSAKASRNASGSSARYSAAWTGRFCGTSARCSRSPNTRRRRSPRSRRLWRAIRRSAPSSDTNLHPHRNPAYAIVTVSLKAHGATPGDATTGQMRLVAHLAERYGHDEVRISHEQNCILPHVHRGDVPAVHDALRQEGLATANVGLASDIIACPGMDYCTLATARSIPIAQGIAKRMERARHRARGG